MFQMTYKNTIGLLAVIFSLALAAGFLVYPKAFNIMSGNIKRYTTVDIGRLEKPFRLGLDLQGGTHLVYEADTSRATGVSSKEAMDSVREVIERRVNLFGVAEPLVQTARAGDTWRLVVDLAGVKDIKQAIDLIGATPFLEFREEKPKEEGGDVMGFSATSLNGSYLKQARIEFDPTTSEPIVGLEFSSEGSKLFEDLTKKNLGKRIAIYLDGVPVSAPTVQSVISGGKAVITGNFTLKEAQILVNRMNAGALPVPIKLISQETVQASLGQNSLERALDASLWGVIVLTIFIIGSYRFPGILGVAALLIYTLFMLAFFKIVSVTLTLAGIAGFVLSLGIAIDANILIFERMKEELAAGRSLDGAIKEGFLRAWSSVRDGNLTTIITALILYWMGSSFVQGFALTLTIGILMSMFTSVFVSRLLLEILAGTKLGAIKFIWQSGLKLKAQSEKLKTTA